MELLRTWRAWVIVTVLVFQIQLPLRYYLGNRDPHDERFAWRMFSPMRMATCVPRFTVDGKPAALGKEFHEAWFEAARRGRFVVVEAMASELCRRHAASTVTVALDCSYMGGEHRAYRSERDGLMHAVDDTKVAAQDVCRTSGR